MALLTVLALPCAAAAQALDFNYIEANYIDVDVDISDSFVEDGETFTLKSDSGSGFQVGGAWKVTPSVHLFGEYSSASQDLGLTAFGETIWGKFDVVRWRVGVGYAFLPSDVSTLYGRISFDRAEFKDLKIEGENLGTDSDDGLGAEFGALWAIVPQLHLQGFFRYTSVGEIDDEEANTFNSDILYGVGVRWFLARNFALQAAYEEGEISTWSAGLRWTF